MIGAALWIATVGHWPLWHTLLLKNETGAVSLFMLLALASQLLLGALIWLAPFGWRWTLKLAITFVLLWTALGSSAMWLLHVAGEAISVSPVGLMQFLLKSDNWSHLLSLPCLITLIVVFLLPMLLLWRTPIRRIPMPASLVSNGVLLIASIALSILTGRLVGHVLPSPLDPSLVPGLASLLQ
jgi:glucan phosphoethanolaminetransferase (alkaline phosphatase superfamily)